MKRSPTRAVSLRVTPSLASTPARSTRCFGDADKAIALLQEAQERGYYLPSEVLRNSDFERLRGMPEFQRLVG